LLYRARRQRQTRWQQNWAAFALAGALVVAMVDEVHQHFVPSRVGSPVDVLIDFCGALLALVAVRRLVARSDPAPTAQIAERS
jgi:VanZ family protein